jgi:taurine dioxygenase
MSYMVHVPSTTVAATAPAAVTVQPLSPAIGAEIRGVDLSQPLDAATFGVVERALLDREVLFFRDQHLTDAQHQAFAERFGPLQRFPFADPVDEATPAVHAIAIDGSLPRRSNADIWHTDATFMQRPPLGSVLRAVALPGSGGDTLFASASAAYDALSPQLKQLLDGLTATHDFTKSSTHRRALHDQYPPVSHPVVRTHPVTGRKAIFVNRIFTVRINELPERESDMLLAFLYDHVGSPDFQVRFTWSPGAVAVWDNRCTQHYAVLDYSSLRVMHRVVIDGDQPR